MRSLVIAIFGVLAPVWAQADEVPLSERAPAHFEMLETIGMYEILEIMAVEAARNSTELETNMFPGRGGAAWQAIVAQLHAADHMIARFDAAFPVDLLPPDRLAEVTAFAESAAGQRIFAGEIAARRAFLDPAVEEAANALFREAAMAGDGRLDLLTEFIEVNDLLERNVMGALNSNFTFYRGLSDGGAFEVEIPEELMLTEVWGQEAELRNDLIEWLYSYQLTAYAEVSDADLEAYIAFGRTEAGQALNAALFGAFDVVFDDMNYQLGVAAGGFIQGDDT